jgi:penicillin-binding protein 2
MNPNDFAHGLTKPKDEYYWNAKTMPTLNRAISATYPPGSTFKMVTALALLEAGISSNAKVICTPSACVKPRARCTGIHGAVNLQQALSVSCNTYFQEMGRRVGIDSINDIAAQLGFGSLTNIELTGEAKGILPGIAWKKENLTGWEQDWHTYDTFYTAMGQGYNSYTTLQLANYAAAIATGKRMQPYIVEQIISVYGEKLYQAKPILLNELAISPKNLNLVQKGMLGVTSPGGTAYSIFAGLDIKVGAKTGTAQTGLADDANDFHGVFVSFAPYDNPEIAFAAIIEYGYRGGTSGGLLFRAIAEEYFK